MAKTECAMAGMEHNGGAIIHNNLWRQWSEQWTTECAMAVMERTMEDRSYSVGSRSDHTEQSMAATKRAMAVIERTMEERTQSERIVDMTQSE